MANRNINGYKLQDCIMVCPECTEPFFASRLEDIPLINSTDIVEADLHRAYPDPEIRAALLALCPLCKYCGWVYDFKPSPTNLSHAPDSAPVSPSKKFALAVKAARAKNKHSLDIAYIALNGLWCAREAGEPDETWLELAAYEHQKGLADHTTKPETDGLSHLIMGELWRQLRQFDAAIEEYKLALLDPDLHKEIANHQIELSLRGQALPTALPARITAELFPHAGYEATGYLHDTSMEAVTEEDMDLAEAVTSEDDSKELLVVEEDDSQSEMLESISSKLPEKVPNLIADSLSIATGQTALQQSEISFAAAVQVPPPAATIAVSTVQAQVELPDNVISFAAHEAPDNNDYIESNDDDYSPPVEGGALPYFSIDDPTSAQDILDNTEMVNDRSEVISKVENYLSFSRQLYKKSWLKKLGN